MKKLKIVGEVVIVLIAAGLIFMAGYKLHRDVKPYYVWDKETVSRCVR